MAELIDPEVLERIQSMAIERLGRSRRRESVNAYVMLEVQDEGSAIVQGHTAIEFDRPTAVVFFDEQPGANWAHDCRYLLFDPETAEMYREVDGLFPPYLHEVPDTFVAFHLPRPTENPLEKRFHVPILWWKKCPIRLPDGERYAILYSGGPNYRHVNDMEFLYRTLVNKYFFNPANITVLNYDGTLNYSGSPKPVGNWPGDNTPYEMTVDAPGTKKAFDDAIDALKPKIGARDLLLIHTNNHGAFNGTDSYIPPFSGPLHTSTDFTAKLAQLPKYRDLVVMMEQCNSGGFNDSVIERSTAERTTFSAAATERRFSWGTYEFDPFARDWISAVAGNDPFGAALVGPADLDGNNIVSMREAFSYADDVHFHVSTATSDSPVYSSIGKDAGDVTLARRWKWLWAFCPIMVKELGAVFEQVGELAPYRELMREQILPSLAELDDKFEDSPPEPEEAAELIREVIRGAL